MKRCPNWDVQWCLVGVSFLCHDCPAYTWQVRLALWLRSVVAWWRAILAALIVTAAMFMPSTAQAAHNPEHNCADWLAAAILAGNMGGSVWGNMDKVDWTDGLMVCIFWGNEAKTLYRSRNALVQVAKDVAKHGLAPMSFEQAQKIVNLAGRTSTTVIVGPTVQAWCQSYPRAYMTRAQKVQCGFVRGGQ